MKRVISLLLIMVMLTGMLPVFAQAEAAEATVSNGGVMVEATNSFGQLLTSDIQQEQETLQDDLRDGYAITGLEVEGNLVKVAYGTLEAATVVIAVYSEDGRKLICSGKAGVLPEDNRVTVTIEGEMPEYFMISAMLVDNYDLSPLCIAYETPMYTREMQELLASTTADYDQDRVLQLGESTATNFAVFTENVRKIQRIEGYNQVISADVRNRTYVIGTPDEQITSLAQGDIFVYHYSEDDFMIAKVQSVTVGADTATITGMEADPEEFFSHVKLETAGDMDDFTYDSTGASDGVSMVQPQQSRSNSKARALGAIEGGSSASKVLQLTIDEEFESENATISLGATLGYEVELEFAYYLSFQRVFVELNLSQSISAEVTVGAEIKFCEIPLGELKYRAYGIGIGFEPAFQVQISGELTISLAIESEMSATFENGEFDLHIPTPKVDFDAEFTGTLFIGIDPSPTLEFAEGCVIELQLEAAIGAEITGTLNMVHLSTEKEMHACKKCIEFEIAAKASLEVSLDVLWCATATEPKEWSKTIGNAYYSIDYKEFGFGDCPHLQYQVTIYTYAQDGSKAEGITVYLDDDTELGTTNKNGLLISYLPEGQHTVTAEIVGKKLSVTKKVRGICSVILSAESDHNQIIKDTQTQQLRPESALVSSYIRSGRCGDAVYWTLYTGGLLKITGSGAMDDFRSEFDIPWYEVRDMVINVHVTDRVSSIGKYAFTGCVDLQKVVLDDCVEKVGDYAFAKCTALTEIKMSSALQSIGSHAFSSCWKLTKVTDIPNLQTIGEYAFADCRVLTHVELPEGLLSFGDRCFYGCGNLTGTVIIPSTVTSIPASCFYGCSSVTKLVIPDCVNKINERAFAGCTGLKEIKLPVNVLTGDNFTDCENVETIHYTYGTNGRMGNKTSNINDSQCYQRTLEYYCREALKTVVFDQDITYIGNYAFAGCTALTEIKLFGDCPAVGEKYAFSDVIATVQYPADNETYTEEAKAAFGSGMTWTPLVTDQTTEEETEHSLSMGGIVGTELSTADAVYTGDNQAELAEDATVYQNSSFEGLVPGEQYVLVAVMSLEVEDLLTADNLLFIDQAAAKEDGTISFCYVQRVPMDEFYVFVSGASNKNLQDAQITVPMMTANGEAQGVQPTVVYDGQVLIEELDYVIVDGKVFIDSGAYTVTLRGINQYSGLVSIAYVVAEEEPDVIVPTLTLKSPTLEFKDMITVNAMFTAENIDDVVEMGMITYTEQVTEWNVETAAHVIPGTSYDATTGRYIAHSQGINAKYLGDTVYLACYAELSDGSYVYTKLAPYSPVQYATSQLKNSTNVQLKQLVAAMLNYGAEAQLFFGHNTDNLANATLTDEQKALPEVYREDMVGAVPAASAEKQGIFANNKGFAKRYPAISFEGAFCINYFFKPNYAPVGDITLYYWNEAEFEAASVLTKENASGTLTLALEDSGEYRADIEGIAAKNLSEAVYVAAVYSDGTTEWTSGVLGYSIGAYCASQISKAADVAALAEATAVYGYHAKQYFG